MKVGAVFPQLEIGRDPGGIRAFAEAAEGLGYDYLLTYEHVLGADPQTHQPWTGTYAYTDMFHEPMVLFAYLAAITKRLEFVNGVLVLPQRQTALVAKQAAELDILSGGRFRMGVGVGWNKPEFQALGADFKTRGSRQEEQIEVLRLLWTNELVTFKGRFHTLEAVGLNPRPRRSIPIWMGTYSERALQRVGRLADGFLPGQVDLDPRMRDIIGKFRQYAKEAGRDPAKLGLDCCVTPARSSSMEQCIERAVEWQAFGATHIRIDTMKAGFVGVQGHIDALRSFRDGLVARGVLSPIPELQGLTR